MARPFKEGLDYFAMDCVISDSLKLIQAEYGLKAFAIVVKLFQKIYGGHGYYCEWNEDRLLLFMSENGGSSDSKNYIQNVIDACIKRDIFSKTMYEKYQILTSAKIQQRYVAAVERRTSVELKKEYLLLSDDNNEVNDNIYSINVSNNSINDSNNSQSKVKESKENKNIYSAEIQEVIDYLNQSIGSRYSTKAASTIRHVNARLAEGYSVDDFKTVIDKKCKEWKNTDMAKYLRPETLFGSKFDGYLNQQINDQKAPPGKNKFHNFDQRNYDFDKLEQQLLQN